MNSEITCRGSMRLGTGCGKCKKCKSELATMENALPEQDQPQTRIFSTKKELAEALMRGEKWEAPGYSGHCLFEEDYAFQFIYPDGKSTTLDYVFENDDLFDGKTLWTKVK